MGAPTFRSKTTPTLVATEAWFAAGSVLEPHTHDRAIFAVMLDGSFEKATSGRRLQCEPAAVWTEPAEERHANYIGARGAHVLVVQPDPAHMETFSPFGEIFVSGSFTRHPGVAIDARRVIAELVLGDSLSPLAIDALIVGMLTAATRTALREATHARTPLWLVRVRDALHDEVARPHRLADLAALADVHPSHLAHTFRRHFHVTVGQYIRNVRLNRALEQLARSDLSISEIAHATGYADQSHLTRECRRVMGVTPASYRSARAHVLPE
jgi:AraC family transcriptional regulator